MGRRAAFHGIAAARVFGDACTLMEQAHFDDVLTQVAQGGVDAGLMAWDNTLAGPIPGNRDRLYSSGLYAVAEAHLPIRLFCMALPGSALDQIQVVRSHPMALQESARFLAGLSAEQEAWGDTASAAASVAEAGNPRLAAIASKEAAKQFHLSILAEGVEDHADNVTRFLVVTRNRPALLNPENVLGGIPWPDQGRDPAHALATLATGGLLVRHHGISVQEKGADQEAVLHFDSAVDPAHAWHDIQAAIRLAFPAIRLYGAFRNGPFLSE